MGKERSIDMNGVTKTILAVIAAVVLLGIVGRCDYNEAVGKATLL